jgi:hypothetical protein
VTRSLLRRCESAVVCDLNYRTRAEAEAERDRYRQELEYALDAFTRAGETHACDYCKADAARIREALGA